MSRTQSRGLESEAHWSMPALCIAEELDRFDESGKFFISHAAIESIERRLGAAVAEARWDEERVPIPQGMYRAFAMSSFNIARSALRKMWGRDPSVTEVKAQAEKFLSLLGKFEKGRTGKKADRNSLKRFLRIVVERGEEVIAAYAHG